MGSPDIHFTADFAASIGSRRLQERHFHEVLLLRYLNHFIALSKSNHLNRRFVFRVLHEYSRKEIKNYYFLFCHADSYFLSGEIFSLYHRQKCPGDMPEGLA